MVGWKQKMQKVNAICHMVFENYLGPLRAFAPWREMGLFIQAAVLATVAKEIPPLWLGLILKDHMAYGVEFTCYPIGRCGT
jgi:hypothetical protein